MSPLVNLLIFFSLCTISLVSNHGSHHGWRSPPGMHIDAQFRQFHRKFMKHYHHGSKEYRHRFAAFKDNMKRIDKLNSQRKHNDSAHYGITKFSDLTQDEFNSRYLSDIHPVRSTRLLYSTQNKSASNRLKIPTSQMSKSNAIHKKPPVTVGPGIPFKLDLRDKNVLGPVRNQKACGGCWAFSVVEAVEAVAAMQTQVQVPLSVQEVIDCSLHYEGALWGCKGGDTCHALKWLKEMQCPLVPEKNYPLKDTSEPCQLPNGTTTGPKVANYTCENLVDVETKIQWYLATRGPLSVSVDATTWNNYMGGIIQFHCGENANNHAVVIVGYDTTGEIPYYIVKNSWGTDFGDNGYVYIMMGDNVCGIAQEVSTVQVDI